MKQIKKKSAVNIVFIGHVDSGKSTICGNIQWLLGKINQSDMRKFEQDAKEKKMDSWYLAYIMDINEEERQKGKTVEVGKATFETPNKRFVILDAPGHKSYVPNMIMGVAQADVAALIVSARTGEFESGFEKGGQTREHALLAKSFGVQKLVVIINKMEDGWNQEKYLHIQKELTVHLKDVCGYDMEKDVSWVPISGLYGDNIVKPVDKAKCSWWTESPLLDILDSLPAPPRDNLAPLRLPILHKLKDQGLFIFGKIDSGVIKTDMTAVIMPTKKSFKIVQIFNADDQLIYFAKAGENIKIKVKDIEEDDIKNGYMICNYESPCLVSDEIETQVTLLEMPSHKLVMTAAYTCVLHSHTVVEEAEVTAIVGIVDSKTQKVNPAKILKTGDVGIVRIKLKNEICMEKYKDNGRLGRFVLRDEGKTIGFGLIEKVKAKKSEIKEIIKIKSEPIVSDSKKVPNDGKIVKIPSIPEKTADPKK